MPSKRQRLGQHMLIDNDVLARIVDAADITGDETVCEAGTGLGIVTAELCKQARRVVSYEVDAILFARARKALQQENLNLVNGDLFKTTNLEFDVFVSNLPYSRSRDAIEWLATRKFKRSIMMVQHEFADKLSSGPGDENYRAVSAMASQCFKISQLFSVDKKSFYPPPRVQSVVLKAIPVRTVTKRTVRNLNLIFSKRNRKASTVAAKAGILGFDTGDVRIDELDPSRLLDLAEML